MALRYENLDDDTRSYMLSEFDRDSADGRLYVCKRLSRAGCRHFPALLRQAIHQHDDGWLAEQLLNLFPSTGMGGAAGRVTQEAPAVLAEREFNRYYMRGLCARAIAQGIAEVEVYRAAVVGHLPEGLREQLGRRHAAEAFLSDLHTTHLRNPAAVSPFGPHTGLSIRLA
jgi:hypothetical protein